MGLAPIAQPPGSETFARPNRASSGPSTSTLARICFTSSYGASGLTFEPASTRTVGALTSHPRPRKRRSAAVVSMSRSAGTLRSRLSPSERSVAHKIGNAAFFAPLTSTVPASLLPPRIRMASMDLVETSTKARAAVKDMSYGDECGYPLHHSDCPHPQPPPDRLRRRSRVRFARNDRRARTEPCVRWARRRAHRGVWAGLAARRAARGLCAGPHLQQRRGSSGENAARVLSGALSAARHAFDRARFVFALRHPRQDAHQEDRR